jgi:PAS domain S-box-containing protein
MERAARGVHQDGRWEPGEHAARSLSQVERLFTGVSSHAVFCFDRSGEIHTWNPGVQSILGYSREQFVQMHVTALFTDEDRRRGVPAGEMERAIREGEAPDDRWQVRADGTRVFVAGMVTPLRDDADGVQGFLKLVRNRTDVLESTARLRHHSDQMEAANREQDAFVAVLAHELRQPLTAILGWARIGQSSRVAQDRAAGIFDRIRRSAEATIRFVNDLLEVSRISSDKLQLSPERIDLATLVNDVIPELTPAADARGVSLEVDAGLSDAVEADPVRIRQVISNLVGNAIKYTPPGGLIHVVTRMDGRDGLLIVSDTGIGIARQDLPFIFDRFRQSRVANDRQTGLGLGLWVVREIVQRHRGSITAASDGEGKGATFTVRLPCASRPAH